MKKASTFRLSSSTSRPADGSVKVGYVRRAHGIKGAVVVRVLGGEDERFVPGESLATDRPDYPIVTIASSQSHKDGLLIAFEGVDTRNEAEELRGASFLIAPEDRRQLGHDEFWPEQLVGLRVVDTVGIDLGVVAELISGAAQDRLVVSTDEGLAEVPFVAAIVTSVDLASGVIIIDPPQGLL